MMCLRIRFLLGIACVTLVSWLSTPAALHAQGAPAPAAPAATAVAPPPSAALPAPPPDCRPRGPFDVSDYTSVEPLPDGRVTFRLCAPHAAWVTLSSNDLPDVVPMGLGGGPAGLPMVRDARGMWSVTTPAAVAPDTYRYQFLVEGVAVPDPQGTRFSLTRVGQFSVFEMPGAAGRFQSFDKDVPHGAVSVVEYWSRSLNAVRRAHVYTPPGYQRDAARYPVLYLVHGAGDSDQSWTSVGHANLILDNLIAAGKAKPMIVVMPFGHTPAREGANILANDDFARDFLGDLMPYVQDNFRTLPTRANRAMAGLSMGGAHTMRVGLTHPDLFDYVGIFSMGLLNPQQVAEYEAANGKALVQAGKSMKLVYYAIGRTDFLYASAAPTRAMMAKHGITPVYHETDGGHTWINWRRYLEDFAPRLFR